MARPSPIPASPAFDATAQGAQFRDLIAIIVQATPKAIFLALHGQRRSIASWRQRGMRPEAAFS
jgi:hypothetical protein